MEGVERHSHENGVGNLFESVETPLSEKTYIDAVDSSRIRNAAYSRLLQRYNLHSAGSFKDDGRRMGEEICSVNDIPSDIRYRFNEGVKSWLWFSIPSRLGQY